MVTLLKTCSDEDERNRPTSDHKLCSTTGSFSIPRDEYGLAIDVIKTCAIISKRIFLLEVIEEAEVAQTEEEIQRAEGLIMQLRALDIGEAAESSSSAHVDAFAHGFHTGSVY